MDVSKKNLLLSLNSTEFRSFLEVGLFRYHYWHVLRYGGINGILSRDIGRTARKRFPIVPVDNARATFDFVCSVYTVCPVTADLILDRSSLYCGAVYGAILDWLPTSRFLRINLLAPCPTGFELRIVLLLRRLSTKVNRTHRYIPSIWECIIGVQEMIIQVYTLYNCGSSMVNLKYKGWNWWN